MLDGLGGEPTEGKGRALSRTEAAVILRVLVVAQAKIGYLHT